MREFVKNTYKIRLWGLMALLIAAGAAHLIMPTFFYPLFPETFPFKMFLILLTGPLEFIMAYGLYRKQTRKLYARLTALWFILLTPFHINMALSHETFNGIPNEYVKEFLWARVLLQMVFVIWAQSIMPRKRMRNKVLRTNLKSV